MQTLISQLREQYIRLANLLEEYGNITGLKKDKNEIYRMLVENTKAAKSLEQDLALKVEQEQSGVFKPKLPGPDQNS